MWCFSTSLFSGSGLDFGGSWASKSAALLAAPGVLDPTAFFPSETLLGKALGEGPSWSEAGQNLLCWGHVGTFFALGRLFFDLGRLLRVCGAFFAHVGRFFRVSGRSGSDFGASRDNFRGSETTFFDVWTRAQVNNAK